jgi:hypothetical protein
MWSPPFHPWRRGVASLLEGVQAIGYDKHFHITRTPLMLDTEGFAEAMEALNATAFEMSEIERRSAERRHKQGTTAVPTSSSLLLFKVPRRSIDG